MADGTSISERVLCKGICYKVNFKKACMFAMMEDRRFREHVAEKIANGVCRDKIEFEDNRVLGGRQLSAELYEDDIDYMYDIFIGKKMRDSKHIELSEEHKWMINQYNKIASQNGSIKKYDITNMLAYAIISSEACTKRLYELLDELKIQGDVYESFVQSEYGKDGFEKVIEAQHIYTSRLLRGLLVKMRTEESEEIYDVIMQIIYAGYRNIKKELKKIESVNDEIIRDIVLKYFNKNMLETVSAECMVFIIADDLNISFTWEPEMYMLVSAMEGYFDELSGFMEYEEEAVSTLTKSQRELLEKVRARNSTDNSLYNMIYDRETDMNHVGNILNMLNISGRKLWGYSLDNKEIIKLLAQKDKWNVKEYSYCLAITVLCKYILSLENIVAEVNIDKYRALVYAADQKEDRLKKEKESLLQKKIEWQDEKKSVNKALIEQRQIIDKNSSIIEKQKSIIAVYEQELTELRSYVFKMTEDWKDININEEQELAEFWKNKNVIVVGGHSRWQEKLKQYFPRWSFLSAETKNFSSDVIMGRDYIVCNTEVLSHSTYYKLLAERERTQKILYAHNNNIVLCLKELKLQIS